MRYLRRSSPLPLQVLLSLLLACAIPVCSQRPSPAPAGSRSRQAQEAHGENQNSTEDECPAVDVDGGSSGQQESSSENGNARRSPARAPHDLRGGYIRKFKYDVGKGEEHSLIYIDNSNLTSSSFHQEGTPLVDGRRLCKFYNLSPRTLHLIRQDDASGRFELMEAVGPVLTAGVTCTVGDHYVWLDRKAPQKPTHEVWIPDSNERHFVYQEAYESLETNKQRERYVRFLRGLKYEKAYREATGRSYLGSPYPPRPPPMHEMWNADYIGQDHVVELDGVRRSFLVISTSPRILIMDNFLNEAECNQIQTLAEAEGFANSATLSKNDQQYRRTSQTSWLRQEQHPVVQSIYQRSGQLLKMPNLTTCCAEDLQVVHYDQNQEYRAHYDFKLPAVWAQPVRFATLLVYLEDVAHGGDTVFPLVAGGPLAIQPQAGTAVLFYSLLPDGNVDERSLHASTPVLEGSERKRVANIWVWDPFIDVATLD